MHDRAPIRALAAEGMPIKAIARELGVDRNTVRRALDPTRPDHYVRADMAALDALEPAIRDALAVYPRMPATGIARRLRWRGSPTAFTARVRRARREVLRAASRSPG